MGPRHASERTHQGPKGELHGHLEDEGFLGLQKRSGDGEAGEMERHMPMKESTRTSRGLAGRGSGPRARPRWLQGGRGDHTKGTGCSDMGQTPVHLPEMPLNSDL